jgi:DNA (cytosine-5)-methyltransferase 1
MPEKKKIDNRSPLFLYIIDIILQIKPKYVFIENVPSFLTSKYLKNSNETILEKFQKELNDLYYINHKKLNTADYGVPQSRNRCILLLSRIDCSQWTFPIKMNEIKTVRDTIGHLPSLNNGEQSSIHKWHRAKNHNDNHILWMSHTPTGKTAFDNPIYFPKKNGEKIKGFRTTYKRMEWDKPAPTITMSSDSISSQNNVHPRNKYISENGDILYDNPRALSIYEIMLLTGLDDDWIPNTDNEKLIREIIGETVPPMFVYHLINNIP